MSLHSSQLEYSLARRVRRSANRLRDCTDGELLELSRRVRYEMLTGRQPGRLFAPAFSLVVESTRRTFGFDLHEVQVLAGIELAKLNIAEMKTGEGKTLTASLPVFFHALTAKGAHVATVNDYLAKRDAAELAPVFNRLGLSVGVIQTGDSPEDRRNAYRSDITYGTAREFGFDFLKDRIAINSKSPNETDSTHVRLDMHLLQRPFNFALVDEADSILLDEARTPLVIAMADQSAYHREKLCFEWAAENAGQFRELVEYEFDPVKKRINLTANGISRLRSLPQNRGTRSVSANELYTYMENAIRVQRDFHREEKYSIVDGEVQIIDEFTGRIADGRQWQDGIHQAVQAKEQVAITPENKQTASITVQTLFRMYPRFAGMTGTAWTSRRELQKIYGKQVRRIPTHRPINRTILPTRVFQNFDSKWQAVVSETREMVEQNRPVLIGTRTIERSEQISVALTAAGLAHQVLNAHNHGKEAEVIARAGQPGTVTVATNMAGRGTDIKLGDSVTEFGGLHVVLTELHQAERIDWQMIGRGCRQGDPGSCRIYLSLEDEILTKSLTAARLERIRSRYGKRLMRGANLPRTLIRLFRFSQAKLQKQHMVDRQIVMRNDKDRSRQFFELGLDPYLNATTSSR